MYIVKTKTFTTSAFHKKKKKKKKALKVFSCSHFPFLWASICLSNPIDCTLLTKMQWRSILPQSHTFSLTVSCQEIYLKTLPSQPAAVIAIAIVVPNISVKVKPMSNWDPNCLLDLDTHHLRIWKLKTLILAGLKCYSNKQMGETDTLIHH